MNLTETLLKEHTKSQRDRIVKYINNNPARFAELVNVFLAGPYRITQRASWPLSKCVEECPELIKPHLKKIVRHLLKPDLHDAVKRNTLRLLQFVSLPESLQGEIADLAFQFFINPKEPIAVRVFAMTVLTNIAKQQPELKNELIPLIEEHLPYEKPAFVSRGRKALMTLKKL